MWKMQEEGRIIQGRGIAIETFSKHNFLEEMILISLLQSCNIIVVCSHLS